MPNAKLICTFIILIFSTTSLLAESNRDNSSFYPTWKLLKQPEKIQYLAGYMHAWQDAQKTISITASFIKDNPDSAVESLKRIESLADFSTLRPDMLAREVDGYFLEGDNQSSSFSQAITAARARLR